MRRGRFICAGVAALGVLLAACGGGNNNTTFHPMPQPHPSPVAGTIVLEPISADDYATLASQALAASANDTGCQGDPSTGVQACHIFQADTDPVTWIAIGGDAAASAPSDGAEAILFYGNDFDGTLAVAEALVPSAPTITGYWKVTWTAPPITVQIDTVTKFVAAFLIDQRQITVECTLPFGQTAYTCKAVSL
jgi:hypothetical protein